MVNVDSLRIALEKARPELEAALADARHDLDALDARRAELVSLIRQTEAGLGINEPARAAERLTLHDAIALVLREQGNRWMSTRELADEINNRGLYHKRDRAPVETSQIHARTKNYSHLFEKDGSLIRLSAD